jgi:cytochrome P450
VLLENPAQAQRLRAEPDLAPEFVEELLRYDTPVQLTTRITTGPVEAGDGVVVPTGAPVNLLLAAANRDPARYPEPHRFNPGRPNIQPVSFGGGVHHCLGAPLARLEAQVAFPLLLDMLPGLALDGPPDRRDRLVLRGLRTMPVTTGSSAGARAGERGGKAEA